MATVNNKVVVSLDSETKRMIGKLTKAIERMPASTVVNEAPGDYHDDGTLIKVYEILENEGLSHRTATDLVSAIQNAGILFRERR